MKQLTVIICDINQISKALKIQPSTFRKDPEKQLDKLRPYYHVKNLERAHSNSKQYFELTPKSENETPAIFK